MPPACCRRWILSRDEAGFTLAELLVSSLLLLLISASVFNSLAESQSASSYQIEVQAVLDNTRVVLETVERYIRQAGNDPYRTGFPGITIAGDSEINLKSDLTGSSGNPDKGDPDGDILDSGEDVTIRYNAAARSVELVPAGGSAQAIAGYISAFSMQYYDAAGAVTAAGDRVRRIKVRVSGASTVPNPKTGKIFGITLTGDILIAGRQI